MATDKPMQLGMVGLDRMGSNLVRRLTQDTDAETTPLRDRWAYQARMGRWTAFAAVDETVPAPVITASLYERFESRGLGEFTGKILSAMRSEFGGHAERRQ
jgi:6-phosphogluconate dehydrogenase (decarboxylating)